MSYLLVHGGDGGGQNLYDPHIPMPDISCSITSSQKTSIFNIQNNNGMELLILKSNQKFLNCWTVRYIINQACLLYIECSVYICGCYSSLSLILQPGYGENKRINCANVG